MTTLDIIAICVLIVSVGTWMAGSLLIASACVLANRDSQQFWTWRVLRYVIAYVVLWPWRMPLAILWDAVERAGKPISREQCRERFMEALKKTAR